MLSAHDQAIANELSSLFRAWQAVSDKVGPDEFTDRAATIIAEANDPQAVWEEHIKWGTALTGKTPDDLPDDLRYVP